MEILIFCFLAFVAFIVIAVVFNLNERRMYVAFFLLFSLPLFLRAYALIQKYNLKNPIKDNWLIESANTILFFPVSVLEFAGIVFGFFFSIVSIWQIYTEFDRSKAVLKSVYTCAIFLLSLFFYLQSLSTINAVNNSQLIITSFAPLLYYFLFVFLFYLSRNVTYRMMIDELSIIEKDFPELNKTKDELLKYIELLSNNSLPNDWKTHLAKGKAYYGLGKYEGKQAYKNAQAELQQALDLLSDTSKIDFISVKHIEDKYISVSFRKPIEITLLSLGLAHLKTQNTKSAKLCFDMLKTISTDENKYYRLNAIADARIV